MHPAALLTVILYTLGVNPLKEVVEVYVDPSILYVNPVPVGAVIVSPPVATLQLGCIGVTAGAEGASGCALMVTLVAVDTHPELFITLRLYVPAATPLNAVDD